jgi:hypothetical protein
VEMQQIPDCSYTSLSLDIKERKSFMSRSVCRFVMAHSMLILVLQSWTLDLCHQFCDVSQLWNHSLVPSSLLDREAERMGLPRHKQVVVHVRCWVIVGCKHSSVFSLRYGVSRS